MSFGTVTSTAETAAERRRDSLHDRHAGRACVILRRVSRSLLVAHQYTGINHRAEGFAFEPSPEAD